MVYKQVSLIVKWFLITPTSMSISPSTLVCWINYCWTKLCLFLDVRNGDHWSRSSCTRKSWRVSVPAAKQCSPRVRFPQLSVQVSVQSEIYSVAGKTYRHTIDIYSENFISLSFSLGAFPGIKWSFIRAHACARFIYAEKNPHPVRTSKWPPRLIFQGHVSRPVNWYRLIPRSNKTSNKTFNRTSAWCSLVFAPHLL